MQKQHSLMLPLAIGLDAIGSILVGLGLAKQLGNVDIVPLTLQFPYFALTCIGVGITLIVSASICVVRILKRRAIAPNITD